MVCNWCDICVDVVVQGCVDLQWVVVVCEEMCDVVLVYCLVEICKVLGYVCQVDVVVLMGVFQVCVFKLESGDLFYIEFGILQVYVVVLGGYLCIVVELFW